MRHSATRFVFLGLLVCALPVWAGPGDQKTLVVRGRTTDQEGFPVERVRVWTEGARKISSISDVDGQYELVIPVGSPADLRGHPLSLTIRADGKDWHFAIPGGDPVLALEVKLETTPDSTMRCVARSNYERFAAAAARAVGMEGEAVGVTLVPFLGLKGDGPPIAKAPEFRFEAHTALDFMLPEPVASAGASIVGAAQVPTTLPPRQPVETVVRDSTPPASRPGSTAASTSSASNQDGIRPPVSSQDEIKPPASSQGGIKKVTSSGAGRASTAPAGSASIRPAPVSPAPSGAAPVVSLMPSVGALGESDQVGKGPGRGSQKSKRAPPKRDRRAANDEAARRVATAVPSEGSDAGEEEAAGSRPEKEGRRESATIHPEPSMKETRSRSRPLLIRAPGAASGSGDEPCRCRVEGTLEVRSNRPLSRRERVEVSLHGYPKIQDTVELFMGSPRLFILPSVPCGVHRLEIRVPSGRRFEVISRDAMDDFRCDQNRAIHTKLVLAPR